MSKTVVPDLEDGFMVLHYDARNRYQTGIECVLVRQKDDGEEERAYLSHECRAEAVSEDPFSHPGNYEFVAISTWTGNYNLRSGSSLFGFNPLRNLGGNLPDAAYEKTDRKNFVSCNDRTVNYLRFGEVIALLQQDFNSGYKKLYMEMSFRRSDCKYHLYAPCRYINFPRGYLLDARVNAMIFSCLNVFLHSCANSETYSSQSGICCWGGLFGNWGRMQFLGLSTNG